MQRRTRDDRIEKFRRKQRHELEPVAMQLMGRWPTGGATGHLPTSVPSTLGCHTNLSAAVTKVRVWIEAARPL